MDLALYKCLLILISINNDFDEFSSKSSAFRKTKCSGICSICNAAWVKASFGGISAPMSFA